MFFQEKKDIYRGVYNIRISIPWKYFFFQFNLPEETQEETGLMLKLIDIGSKKDESWKEK